MPATLLIALLIGAAPLERPVLDTLMPGASMRAAGDTTGEARWMARAAAERAAADTTRRRRSVEVGEWYERRLVVHRWTAYAVPALFAYQYWVGDKMLDAYRENRAAPAWTNRAHRNGRTAIATAFGINAVTGLWNLWETRAQPEGRTARLLHAASMMGASAGFAVAGIKLADEIDRASSYESALDARERHRNVALGSMAVTLVSGIAMWAANR